MDIDIRKPDMGAMQINRPLPNSASTTAGTSSPAATSRTDSPHEFGQYTEPVSEGEEDEDMGVQVANDEEGRIGLSKGQASDAIKFRTEMLRKQREQEAAARSAKGKQPAISEDEDEDDGRIPFLKTRRNSQTSETPLKLAIDPLQPSLAFDKTFNSKLQKPRRSDNIIEEEDEDEENQGHSGEYNGPPARESWLSKVWQK